MRAVHVFWTAPYRSRGVHIRSEFILGLADRLVLAASALLWRMHSGPIALYTDVFGYDLLQGWSISDVWSEINIDVLVNAPQDIDAGVFWDLGKSIVLAKTALPFALLDLDLIVWRPLEILAPVQFFHWEEIEEPWYPPSEKLSTSAGYSFPNVDWSVRPGNTALMYISDGQFRNEFVRRSIEYATNNHPHADGALSAFLFSGQRLFTLIGHKGPWLMRPFIPYVYRAYGEGEWLGPRSTSENPLSPHLFLRGWPYMHLWRLKHELRRNEVAEKYFADQLIDHVRLISSSIANRLRDIRSSFGTTS